MDAIVPHLGYSSTMFGVPYLGYACFEIDGFTGVLKDSVLGYAQEISRQIKKSQEAYAPSPLSRISPERCQGLDSPSVTFPDPKIGTRAWIRTMTLRVICPLLYR